MNLFFIVVIAISLSMDAFSLSLAYGTLNIDKKDIITISLTISIYHFFMPLLGRVIGAKLLTFIPINNNILVFIILFIIGLEMIIDTLKKEENISKMSFLKILLFAFTVSIDSFSVGIGLNNITNTPLLAYFIFSLSSFIFTFIGLCLGKKISQLLGRISTLVGGSLLILIASLYLI